MPPRHALLLIDLGDDASAALAALRLAAPRLGHLTVAAVLPGEKLGWLSDTAPTDLSGAAKTALGALEAEVAEAAARIELRVLGNLDPAALDELAAASQADLIVSRTRPLGRAALITELRKRRSLAVLWLPATTAPGPRRSDTPPRLLCVWPSGRRAGAALAAFLRDRADDARHIAVLDMGARAIVEPSATAAVAGIPAGVHYVWPPAGESPQHWLQAQLAAGAIDLLIYPRLPIGPLLDARWPAPILLLAPLPPLARLQRRLDAADGIEAGGAVRIRLEYVGGIGWSTPIPDQEIVFVAEGKEAGRALSSNGQVVLPAACRSAAYGLYRSANASAPSNPLAVVEQLVSILRPGGAPLLLCDAELAVREAASLHRIPDGFELLAVRLRPTRDCRSIRARLAATGLQARVVDASTVLDEGSAFDVSDELDAVRLARVAVRLRASGFAIAAIVHRSPTRPAALGFAELHVDEIAGHHWPAAADLPAHAASGVAALLDATGALPIAGNRVDIELDNALARRWLLRAIAASRRSVHLQVYMAADDDVGRRIERALSRAAARGIAVRVLVDSLHGLHGSLGVVNPLLGRLESQPGIALRVSRPVTGLPSLHDLKQRDHRKLVVVDGELALVGGRNLSHEYYTGFDEVALAPDSPWRQVPWLDAGARVRGPAVARLEQSFLEAWTQAGGAAFPVVEPAPAGATSLRVVNHHGLRDAHTLEAYLALIDTARERIDVVNGFPLILEIQHALLRALARGVQVRTVFGHLAPSHAGGPFEGPWARARKTATMLVHSRMDALIAAGAEAYEFAVPERPRWTPGLGTVRSHVHAKLMIVDGEICSVGSANMDITAGYWENELMLLVPDTALATSVQARLDTLLAGSIRVDRNDPRWREMADQRQWLRYWPGLLSI